MKITMLMANQMHPLISKSTRHNFDSDCEHLWSYIVENSLIILENETSKTPSFIHGGIYSTNNLSAMSE